MFYLSLILILKNSVVRPDLAKQPPSGVPRRGLGGLKPLPLAYDF